MTVDWTEWEITEVGQFDHDIIAQTYFQITDRFPEFTLWDNFFSNAHDFVVITSIYIWSTLTTTTNSFQYNATRVSQKKHEREKEKKAVTDPNAESFYGKIR